MQRAHYDIAGHHFVPSEGVTLASLGVPPHSPPVEDWGDDEFGFAEAGQFGALPPAVSGIEVPSGTSFAHMVRTISPAAEPGAWREDNSAPFWIPDDPRALAGPSFDDLVRTIDPRADPDLWRDNSPLPYAAWDDSDRYIVPYDPRAAALGEFRIPGLPDDATGWGPRERFPDDVSDVEPPDRLVAQALGQGVAGGSYPRPRRSPWRLFRRGRRR